ncbi:MAG: S-adenosylmethionine:tRNA ribosyltransferase-isomerase [Ferrovum sp. 37-45-19]|uniref:tRNA preQ1(34) S-adenosylmethionine ribosyltransferase-isomerase QueA n=1 Tax=Ferrovum sp. JA12 TaxID=1356299 RepID=UPI00070391A7|nr:tRNA preQ1(34) S-adenosylmethionine ribosyltransferase-isomerase QueA [Ferrovum sp. JA12]OYV79776.1 MAG: S-adenosylmethionine:tRNA ribosyltransferase-isomerase [Ferrovum sp. 21-44-67]OYV95398.1 MAG: S-adenosylmethionine:tRNA ribosyltransferase-isomerase [Ferrovum sp. 37-45-19]OZB31456.1 MAG: S-adenosylmethionine:tRNA ribosyltransferase-isomerase [Ferrovum sp. 34-44-207]HQT81189.1 tRNA preQ1(34) S-adenosylmethionine ribosyltransferase-isomerase QueA [Ferrovaceae bacterium]HQU05642.1 tRNA pre
MKLRTDDFDYFLPESLIAQTPVPQRTHSRLMVVGESTIEDSYFYHLDQWLRPHDLLILNNTQVLKARLFGKKDSGGKVECLVERVSSPHRALVHFRASHAPKPGSLVYFDHDVALTVTQRVEDLFEVEFVRLSQNSPQDFFVWMEQDGVLPLPPYIDRSQDLQDIERYQTVYAQVPGAIAAPTAGLHFDEELFERLREKGVAVAHVTLHVGAGTFAPVKVDFVEQHVMHKEWYFIPEDTIQAIKHCQERGGRVIAVGTTSMRALESGALNKELQAGSQETDIFITPGFEFKVIDMLVTNFHLPRSTLLMLVSAFSGLKRMRRAYQHAIDQKYRFFSYGDAMLLTRGQDQ